MSRNIKLELNIAFSGILPIIPIKLSGFDNNVLAVIDTGSEVTILDSEVSAALENCKSKSFIKGEESIALVGVTQEKAKIETSFATLIDIFDDRFANRLIIPVTGIVSPISGIFNKERSNNRIVLLLGSDFLRKRSASIDFKRRRLCFFDRPYQVGENYDVQLVRKAKRA